MQNLPTNVETIEMPADPMAYLIKEGVAFVDEYGVVWMRDKLPHWTEELTPAPFVKSSPNQNHPVSDGPWETLQSAARRTGYAYNTFKKWRYLGVLPFPIHEDRLYPGQRPKITVKTTDVDSWKAKTKVVAGKSGYNRKAL